jgi:phosphoglycerate dehydrogenase-like enzyme
MKKSKLVVNNKKEGNMATGKVVVISPQMESAIWDIFQSEKPSGWQFTLVNQADGEPKLLSEVNDADYLISLMGGRPSVKVLENAKHLKLLQTMGQGTEHLPVKRALELGIPVANAGGANAMSVAEHTLLLMLACLKRFEPLSRSTREGKFWGNSTRIGSHELYDKTVGIVGFGNIGRRVGKLAYGFGANIIYNERLFVPYALRADSHAKPVSLDELLRQSDIVTLHVPSFESNRAMVGWNQFTQMKPTAYLINTSRGNVIDERALVRALDEKKIAGAGIDVWDPEPPAPENPLFRMPNVAVSPHMAGLSDEMLKREFATIWNNVIRVSEGQEPLNRLREF